MPIFILTYQSDALEIHDRANTITNSKINRNLLGSRIKVRTIVPNQLIASIKIPVGRIRRSGRSDRLRAGHCSQKLVSRKRIFKLHGLLLEPFVSSLIVLRCFENLESMWLNLLTHANNLEYHHVEDIVIAGWQRHRTGCHRSPVCQFEPFLCRCAFAFSKSVRGSKPGILFPNSRWLETPPFITLRLLR